MSHKRRNGSPFHTLLCLIAALWLVEAVNLLSGHQLCRWGILPRTLSGLRGIPLSPFLHAGPGHLLLNTAPLAILGGLVLVSGRRRFLKATAIIILAGGLGLWFIGRPSYHVGASGLIFGYFGFLLARGILIPRPGALLIAVLTAVAYGGMFWGLAPTWGYVSWEGHICGFAAGIMAARMDARAA